MTSFDTPVAEAPNYIRKRTVDRWTYGRREGQKDSVIVWSKVPTFASGHLVVTLSMISVKVWRLACAAPSGTLCGNSLVEDGEECDVGAGQADECCNEQCKLKARTQCRLVESVRLFTMCTVFISPVYRKDSSRTQSVTLPRDESVIHWWNILTDSLAVSLGIQSYNSPSCGFLPTLLIVDYSIISISVVCSYTVLLRCVFVVSVEKLLKLQFS